MGFKIGDRVMVNDDCGSVRDRGRTGVVTSILPDMLWPVRVRLDDNGADGAAKYRELALLPPLPKRGPKPLALTGGTRFTVRQGMQLLPVRMRAPIRHAGRDITHGLI